MAANAHDCVRFFFVRDGSVILNGDCLHRPAGAGDVVMVAPDVLFGYEPEGKATLTTLNIDTDYLIEHLFWQHVNHIPDRDAARMLAPKLYPDPIQVLRLGEREVERLHPALDELVIRTESEQDSVRYFRTHALLFAVLDAIAPHVRHASVTFPVPSAPERRASLSTPRWRRFRPLRAEAHAVEQLLRSDISRRWYRDELAAHACLSPAQMCRVFAEAYGVSPLTYLTILRVEEMGRLIRETDLTIETIGRRVGWHNRDFASAAFRRHFGVNPSVYRRHGPPTASAEGPGVGVARAAAHSASDSAQTMCSSEAVVTDHTS